ncbi:MAG: hypothetical protein LBC82_09810 [Oscillospiraceae bacterium]|jgi:hypothetical protein|nr:hypothetical protein [Oscillospiraceae bacterium]
MTLTKTSLQKYGESMRISFAKEQERVIIERFGTEPDDGHTWSEQDIAEQIRKICGAR